MEYIFHERQEGSLCAQHCLNALLQGQYFTAVDLAEIARQLDDSERNQMAEGGVDTEEYRKFLEEPSSNMDDSGFFSIQVIQNALSVWGLELVPYKSQNPIAQAAQALPTSQHAYICNFKEHWLSIRKLGNQWFNLNSLLTGPELISDTYLAMLLTQLQQEGYSIFIVVGTLQETDADQILKLMPAVQPIKPKLISDLNKPDKSGGASKATVDQAALQRALDESQHLMQSQDEADLEAAMRLSMEGLSPDEPGPSTSTTKQPDPEELRRKRLAYLDNIEKPSLDKEKPVSEMSEEDQLQAAINMSMSSS
ncbi:unnamed protein product [Owenia fusiformis]|uniref:ubiquitinyl hydrolase 1 n=1 Tax=Owenia fusiformis TaxID=6347 RepID=A0A8J1U4Z0_OWEFU|nr:unnamed protein product [Owenia fusiformis]